MSSAHFDDQWLIFFFYLTECQRIRLAIHCNIISGINLVNAKQNVTEYILEDEDVKQRIGGATTFYVSNVKGLDNANNLHQSTCTLLYQHPSNFLLVFKNVLKKQFRYSLWIKMFIKKSTIIPSSYSTIHNFQDQLPAVPMQSFCCGSLGYSLLVPVSVLFFSSQKCGSYYSSVVVLCRLFLVSESYYVFS